MEAVLEKGEEIGLKKGLEKGEKLGRLETARRLLKLGIDLKIIRDTTGISEEEL